MTSCACRILPLAGRRRRKAAATRYGAGVTAGLDFGLQMVAELRDANYAQNVELLCEYDPQPPFHSGSLHTASPEVQSTMRGMLAGFVSRAHDVAKKANS